MYSKTLICVQRLCRIEIVPDYTGPVVLIVNICISATDGEGVNHSATLYLYEAVVPGESQVTNTPRGFYFVLKRKERGGYWVRLLKHKQKVNNNTNIEKLFHNNLFIDCLCFRYIL